MGQDCDFCTPGKGCDVFDCAAVGDCGTYKRWRMPSSCCSDPDLCDVDGVCGDRRKNPEARFEAARHRQRDRHARREERRRNTPGDARVDPEWSPEGTTEEKRHQ